MAHLALYRKYRPKTFSEVYGQEHITSILKYESSEGKLSHAYLFCGPRGTGKTTCAKILAKVANCDNPVNGEPCGKCFACRSIDSESATDVVEMDAASNTGVDYIRDIKDEVSYTPATLKNRVYIIDEVHMLSINAFNALLKTLEEPPEHVIFILATTEQHKLPATVVSRCQRFDFRRIPLKDMSSRLKEIAGLENISLEDEAADLIAKQASGGMRDAINLFELCAAGSGDVTKGSVIDSLGITGIENIYNVACAVKKSDFDALLGAVDSTVSSSKDIVSFLEEIVSFWRNMTVIKYIGGDSPTLELTAGETELVTQASKMFTVEELMYHSRVLEEALNQMNRLPQIKRYTLETAFLRMSDKKLDPLPPAVLARISSLENEVKLLKAKGTIPVEDPYLPEHEVKEVVTKTNVSNEPVSGEDIKVKEKAPADEPVKLEPEMNRITERGEFLEKIGEKDPLLKAYLSDAELLMAADGSRAVFKVATPFFKNMILSEHKAIGMIGDALITSGLCNTVPKVSVEVDESPKSEQTDFFDELI